MHLTSRHTISNVLSFSRAHFILFFFLSFFFSSFKQTTLAQTLNGAGILANRGKKNNETIYNRSVGFFMIGYKSTVRFLVVTFINHNRFVFSLCPSCCVLAFFFWCARDADSDFNHNAIADILNCAKVLRAEFQYKSKCGTYQLIFTFFSFKQITEKETLRMVLRPKDLSTSSANNTEWINIKYVWRKLTNQNRNSSHSNCEHVS